MAGTSSDMRSLDDEDTFVKILYYGEYKTGKTTCAAAAARLGNVRYIDSESGLKKRPLLELGIPVERIFPARFDTYLELEGLLWDLRAAEQEGTLPTTLVWDSTAESQKKLVEARGADQFQKAQESGKPREQFFLAKDDWGFNTSQMRTLIRGFRDLPLHVVFCCPPRRDQDEDGSVKYGPALTPAVGGDLMGYVDIICRTDTVLRPGEDEPEYWGYFRAQGKYQGGDRFHALPPRLINPTFDRVVAYVQGDLTRESDPQMQAAAEAARERKQAKAGDGEAKEGNGTALRKAAGARR